jgi:hypothetical protein
MWQMTVRRHVQHAWGVVRYASVDMPMKTRTYDRESGSGRRVCRDWVRQEDGEY